MSTATTRPLVTLSLHVSSNYEATGHTITTCQQQLRGHWSHYHYISTPTTRPLATLSLHVNMCNLFCVLAAFPVCNASTVRVTWLCPSPTSTLLLWAAVALPSYTLHSAASPPRPATHTDEKKAEPSFYVGMGTCEWFPMSCVALLPRGTTHMCPFHHRSWARLSSHLCGGHRVAGRGGDNVVCSV